MTEKTHESGQIVQWFAAPPWKPIIKITLIVPMIMGFFPLSIIAFATFVITQDTIWLERQMTVLKYGFVWFSLVMCLFALIAGSFFLLNAIKELKNKSGH